MAKNKVTLLGTQLETTPEQAIGVARRLVELDVNADGTPATPPGNTADNLNLAMQECPQIGDNTDFPTPVKAAPNASITSGLFSGESPSHLLRVDRLVAATGDTNNGNKIYVSVFYKSRQRPVIENGYTAIQQQTETYLPDHNAGNLFPNSANDPTSRQQMVLDWKILKGSFTPDKSWPLTDIQLLKTPVKGSMFRFGSSIRISSMWYGDEVTQIQWEQLAQVYTTTTNKSRTPLAPASQVLIPDDSQKWLITGLNTVTGDGGWTTRATLEMVYCPWGWDTYSIYVDGFTGSIALLDNDTVAKLYASGNFDAGGNVASSFAPAGLGCGRFVQQASLDFSQLLGFMSQGIFGVQNTLDEILGNSPSS